MSNIFVFSQNLILDSLKKHTGMPRKGRLYLFVTTHFLFENERSRLISLFGRCRFHTFADFLSDAEMAECDITAYTSKNIPYGDYLAGIKRRKNEIVCRRVLEKLSHRMEIRSQPGKGTQVRLYLDSAPEIWQ